ncbi:MAG: tetratricopeptide repeat protein, partial [Isosphaerales bacterium]
MATEGEKIQGLCDFFLESFEAAELRRFLTYNGYKHVASAVNKNVDDIEYFLNIALALARRGLIDDAFFDSLTKVRPLLEARIRGLQESWRVEEKTSPKSSGSASSSDPRKMIEAEPPATQHQTSVTPPSGNVTFVFTDIESSSRMTRRLEELGAHLYETHLRDPHRERLLGAVERHGGFEIHRAGDGHMFVFQNAGDALRCVVAFQQSLAGEPITYTVGKESWSIRVRVAVHTAIKQRAPEVMQDGKPEYSGNDTNYAARIGALGAGEQIIVSEQTYRVASEIGSWKIHEWPNRLLKSFDDAPQTVYEILYRDGQKEREPGTRFFPSFYEGELNRYIPRPEKEAEVLGQFAHRRSDGTTSRLVTIKAEGGMGKTRLAVSCAVKMVGVFEDGSHFVSLALVGPTVEAVAEAIGRALGLSAEAARPEELFQALRARNMLLILDNYEAVQCDAVGRYLAKLATETSGVCLLVTGRQAVGESLVEQQVSLDDGMTHAEAHDLFVARARLKGKLTGVVSGAAEVQLERIIALTERIPLALELAAAWVEYEELKEIAGGLEATPLGDESGPPPGAIRADDENTRTRHRSLERSLEWSYNLLGPKEGPATQEVFAASGLFADTFDAATLAAVSADGTAKNALLRLQNAALVRRVAVEGATRYRLHRFTRDYAARRLAELPTADATRRRFVAHYVRLVEESWDKLNDLDRIAVLDNEWRNVAAAAGTAEAMNDNWSVMVLSAVGGFLNLRGLWSEREQLNIRAVAAARATGDRRNLGAMLNNLGIVYQSQGRWAEAIDAYQQSLAIRREFKDRVGEGRTLNNLGVVYQSQGRWAEAIDAYQQSLAIRREFKDRVGEGQTLNNLGIVYKNQGRWAEAIDACQQDLAICREFKDRVGEGQTLNNLGNVYDSQGRWAEAIDAYQQSLVIR